MARTDTGERRTEDIRHDLEETRLDMSRTLDELERKLSPRQLLDQVYDMLRGREGRPSKVIGTIRDNPIPALMVAAGIGWLAIEGRGGRGPVVIRRGRVEPGETPEGLGEKVGEAKERLQDVAGRARDTAAGYVETAREKMQSARESARSTGEALRERAQMFRERASGVADNLSERASRFSSNVSERAAHTREYAKSTFKEHPLAVGAAILAAGLAVGLAVRTSHRERELLGETRERLAEGARQAGSEVLGKTQRVAEEAMKAAEAESKREAVEPPTPQEEMPPQPT